MRFCKLFAPLILLALVISCGQQDKTEVVASSFDLKEDFVDFKNKLTAVDTLSVFFDHSVCTYEGYEIITITKSGEQLEIKSTFTELGDGKKEKVLYLKKLALKDTVWQFEAFLKRNEGRQQKEGPPVMVIRHKQDTLRYFADGLVDLNQFFADYYQTMRPIFPENTNGVYGVDAIDELE